MKTKEKIKKIIIKKEEKIIITTSDKNSFVLISNINNKININVDNNIQKYII